jgi:orotate phosphoribosyltransferase
LAWRAKGREVHVIRRQIEELREEMLAALKHDGPYPLSSGRQSNYYYDGKLRTLEPRTALLLANILVDPIVDLDAEAVGGLAIGSIPISQSIGIAAHLRGHYLPTFYVLKEPKTHGTRVQAYQAELPNGEELLTKGRRVVIVDDVITTGKSIQQAIDVVQSRGCIVKGVIALVERHESEGQLEGQGFPVLRIFRTDDSGNLRIDDDFVRAAERASGPRVLS